MTIPLPAGVPLCCTGVSLVLSKQKRAEFGESWCGFCIDAPEDISAGSHREYDGFVIAREIVREYMQ